MSEYKPGEPRELDEPPTWAAAIADLRELRALRDTLHATGPYIGGKYYLELAKQNAKLVADVARALGWDNAEQWTTAMAQIDVGQKAIEHYAKLVAVVKSVSDVLSDLWPTCDTDCECVKHDVEDVLASVKEEQG